MLHWSTHLHPIRPPSAVAEACLRVRDPITAFTGLRRGDWLLFLLVRVCSRADSVRLASMCAQTATGLCRHPYPGLLVDSAVAWAETEQSGDWRSAHQAYRRCVDFMHTPPTGSDGWPSTEQYALRAAQSVARLVGDSRLAAQHAAEWAAEANAWAWGEHDPEVYQVHLASLADALRAQRVTGRPLKRGELTRARPRLQVCHDHVVSTIPVVVPLSPVALLYAFVLRRALQAALVVPLDADHAEPWSGVPSDVDVHTLTSITQRIAMTPDPVAHLTQVLQFLDLQLEAVGQWAGIRAISPSP